MTGLQLWVNRTLVYSADAVKLGAKGLLGIHWHTKDISPTVSAIAQWPWRRDLTAQQLYRELCMSEFGLESNTTALEEAVAAFQGSSICIL